MEEHKSNILELLHCFDLTEEQDFREMSRKFKEGSSLLAGTAVTFGTVFLLLELLKEVKELKTFFMEKDNPKELNQQIKISGNVKGTPEEMGELIESISESLHSKIKEESIEVTELKELSSELQKTQTETEEYILEKVGSWVDPEKNSEIELDLGKPEVNNVNSSEKLNHEVILENSITLEDKEIKGIKKPVVKKPIKKSTKSTKTTSKSVNKKSPKVE